MSSKAIPEKLYYGVCVNCKKRYENIPESQTSVQVEGKYRFISCTESLGLNKFNARVYCGGLVELFPQSQSEKSETQ